MQPDDTLTCELLKALVHSRNFLKSCKSRSYPMVEIRHSNRGLVPACAG